MELLTGSFMITRRRPGEFFHVPVDTPPPECLTRDRAFWSGLLRVHPKPHGRAFFVLVCSLIYLIAKYLTLSFVFQAVGCEAKPINTSTSHRFRVVTFISPMHQGVIYVYVVQYTNTFWTWRYR